MAMLKVKNFISLLFVVALLLLISVENVSATVGGPTYIERLSYSADENSLYYLINNQGGRGCPPEIEKINLATKERVLVMSCDKIEATYYTKDGFDSSGYDQFIQNTFKALISLPNISLQKNDISVAIDYISERRQDEYTIGSDFQATVSQGGKEKEKISFIGCHKDQPNIFRGFFVPDTRKMVIMISRIGDCFEGGYTKDDIHVLDNIDFHDTATVGYYNSFSGPKVQQGDLVASAQRVNTTPTTPPTETKQMDFIIVWGAGVLVVGLGVGYLIGRKTKSRSS